MVTPGLLRYPPSLKVCFDRNDDVSLPKMFCPVVIVICFVCLVSSKMIDTMYMGFRYPFLFRTPYQTPNVLLNEQLTTNHHRKTTTTVNTVNIVAMGDDSYPLTRAVSTTPPAKHAANN